MKRVKNLISIIKKRVNSSKVSDVIKFQKLTPINTVDLSIYEEALNFVFTSNDIKNVAISGPYSSGKSSVLETFKRLHNNKIFLHISLAHFTEMDGEKIIKNDEVNEPILEGKIINQLLHQIAADKIPQTNFKVKKEFSKSKLLFFSSLIVILVIFLLYLIFHEEFSGFVEGLPEGSLKFFLDTTITHYFRIIVGIVTSLIFTYIIFAVSKAQINKNIVKKLSFQGSSFELFDEKAESYFDKYLNEVLYIFKNSNADVIVFEDMDRYNANQIFVKLREINTLVNCKNEKLIRFFYLLRDDIFTSKDRAKFFDFIIPIVPVIDSSNSYDQFIHHLEVGQIIDRFDKYFLQEMSLYIDDMRILKNIYNEYLIYHEKIKSIEPDNNKLLALITYKNLFPRDFGYLQFFKGYVHSLFENKPTIIKEEADKLNSKIESIDEKIKNVGREILEDIDELNAIFLNIPNNATISTDNVSRRDIRTYLDVVKAMKTGVKNISISTSSHTHHFNSKNNLDSFMANANYIKRKEIIEGKQNNLLDKLVKEKNRLKYHFEIINNKSLQEIITKENVDKVFFIDNNGKKETQFSDIVSSQYFPLIIYLIRNGYIDETYSDYITYFYPNSISREDKIFLRSITDKSAKEYNYKLKNIDSVVSRLKYSSYAQEEILNFDLLSYLIENKDKNEQYIKCIFNILISKENIDFIINFIDTQKDTLPILKCIVDFWPNFLELFFISQFDKKQAHNFIFNLLDKLEDNEIEKMNSKNILAKFISNFSELLLRQNISNIGSFVNKLKLISVRFNKFERQGINLDLYDLIYKNALYQINFNTIVFILTTKYNIENKDDIVHKNYTSILSKPDEPLCDYIHANINTYLPIILNNSEGLITDNESAVIRLLNNADIDEKSKKDYICILKSIISNINNINDKSYWDILMQRNCIKICESNIFSYYFESGKGLSEFLIGFINNHTGFFEFTEEELNRIYGEDATSNFINDILECKDLTSELYEKIIRSSQRTYESFDKKGILNEKITVLINAGSILMTVKNLIFMRSEYADSLLLFILKNMKLYVELVNEDNTSNEELIDLLDREIVDADKIRIVKKIQGNITIKNKNYSEVVKTFILSNKFYLGDISYLIATYDEETENMKVNIIIIITKNIKKIISEQFPFSYNLLMEIIKSIEIDHSEKKEIIVNHISRLNISQIKECFELIKEYGYLQLFDGKRPKILKSESDEKILTALKEKEVIKKFEIDKKNVEYYRVFGRKEMNRNGEQLC